MDIFTPITNAQCGMPLSGGNYRQSRRVGGKRKTPRYINIHSPKLTRRGRKNRKTRKASRRY